MKAICFYAFTLMGLASCAHNPSQQTDRKIASNKHSVFQVSDSERADHLARIDAFVPAFRRCFEQKKDHHDTFRDEHGFSPYFSRVSPMGDIRRPLQHKLETLRYLGVENPKDAYDQMEELNTGHFAMRCLAEALSKSGQSNLISRFRDFVTPRTADPVMAALEALGWRILYWNPNPKNSADIDDFEQDKDVDNSRGLWGYHEYRLKIVEKHRTYAGIEVDDAETLVDYLELPDLLKNEPFFFGSAHGGAYLFAGTKGRVLDFGRPRFKISFHKLDPMTILWTDMTTSIHHSKLSPAQYRSGIIAIPPTE